MGSAGADADDTVALERLDGLDAPHCSLLGKT
jgi:hypothetical protein